MADLDRETLFANEALVIGMLQAVSGGSIVAALAQADALIEFGGRLSFFAFVTAASLSLMFAVLAAYWKHQYKMWDVKSSASEGQADHEGMKAGGGNKEFELRSEASRRRKRANRYLSGMRRVILLAVATTLIGVGQLVVAFWYQELCEFKDVSDFLCSRRIALVHRAEEAISVHHSELVHRKLPLAS